MRVPAMTSFDSDPRAALDGVHDAVRRADVTITEDEIEAEIEACRRERAAAKALGDAHILDSAHLVPASQ